jgi:NhaP-type Na+/H+ or K+/H+ antiporter
MTADLVYLLLGVSLLLAMVLPVVLHNAAVSAPIVLVVVGGLIGLLPIFGDVSLAPTDNLTFVEHLTELTVIVALMGVGLALDRPLEWRRPFTWRRWGATWRLLGIAMPLCIAGVALLGWWVAGLAPAAALLLGAVLAPTDPVLASDVQVGGPTSTREKDPDEIDEDDDVRFALTSEAGLNDGLAFPFVYAAIMAATMGAVTEWGLRWVAWELLGKVAIGVVVGTAVGFALTRLAFSSPAPSLRLAEIGEPLLSLAAVLLSYGVAEVAQGYGFLAVFACAMSMRSWERGHDYHAHMHESIERLERLLTLIVLLLLGVALTNGVLENLGWPGILVGLALVFVIRPLTGIMALRVGYGRAKMGKGSLDPRECWATAFFGVRGVGSLFYLAYAMGEADFGDHEQLWGIVAFTVTLSVLVHGISATPVMKRLEALAEERARG